MDWSYQLQMIQILHFCLPCSICAISVLLSLALIWEKKHWAVQEICACRASILGVQQSAITPRHLPAMQLLLQRGRDFLPLCVSPFCSWNPVCVKSLPSEVLTYLLLSSARIFSWPRISSRPSGWPWHSHRTSSLSSLLTETAVQGNSGWVKHFTCKVQEKAVFYFQQLSSGFHSRWKLVPFPQMWDLRLEC